MNKYLVSAACALFASPAMADDSASASILPALVLFLCMVLIAVWVVRKVISKSRREKSGHKGLRLAFAVIFGLAVFVFYTSNAEKSPSVELAVDTTDARNVCRDFARSKASHPTTIDFKFGESVVSANTNGAFALLGFTAENSFGVADHFVVMCAYNPGDKKWSRTLAKMPWKAALDML